MAYIIENVYLLNVYNINSFNECDIIIMVFLYFNIGGLPYVFAFNVLDFPAGVVRMTKVTSLDIEAMSSYPEKDADYKLVKRVSTPQF